MSKKSNDSIEEFFKKGVRKSDITFRESDWQKMERMLDDKAVVGSASTSRSLKRIVSIAVIVALLSSVYFLISDKDQTSSPKQTDQISANTEANNQAPAENQNESVADRSQEKELSSNITPITDAAVTTVEATTINPTSKKASDAASKQNQTATQQSNAIKQERRNRLVAPLNRKGLEDKRVVNIDRNHTTTKTSEVTAASTDIRNEKKGTLEGDLLSNTTAPSPSAPMTTDVVSDKKESEQTIQKQNIDPTYNGALSSVISASESKEDSIAAEEKKEKDGETNSVQSVTDEDKNEKTITPSRWSVAFVVAPEFSSTSMDKQTEPGSAYGLTIGYRILNRLTISAGILKTHKKYVGYGEDYQPPEGYWQYRTNGVVPDEVSGQCSVIEVPLMLQFDVVQSEKSRVFVAGGVSSYRMLNEAYRYQFNEPNDGAADGWSTDQPSSYYFSVGHLSLGYDRRLYRGLYVGIEPYLKIPFKGIGWSNVDLLTMGAYVNVRYRFSKRN